MSTTEDRYNYMGRCRERQMATTLRERRRITVNAAPQVSVQVSADGHNISECFFDAAPTLGQLVDAVGREVKVISVTRVETPTRPMGGLRLVAE